MCQILKASIFPLKMRDPHSSNIGRKSRIIIAMPPNNGHKSGDIEDTQTEMLTRKPCCRKETARCRSCSFRFKVHRRHSLQV